MKNVRALVALFLVSVFLAGHARANTSSINPNVPAQNSPLSSSVLRGNFGDGYNDINTIFGMITLSSNELLGTVNAGNAGPLNLPTCSTGALSWTPGTGFGCNSINGLTSPITQSLVFTGNDSFNLNSTSLPTKQVGTVIQLGNADTIPSRIENDAFAASAYFSGVRSDGTNASPTTLQNLDEMSGINAWGYNGSSVVGPRAALREFAAQNWTGSAQGTRVDISTTLNNTTTMSPVCGFENDGGVTCPPTVTGGDQGAGKINAAGLFVNGVAVSTGGNAFSSLTAALATNSLENGAFTQSWAWDGITTQTALQHTSTTITTGELANFSIANAASTGYAGYFSNTGTGIAYGIYATEGGAANTGYAGYFNNTATATGYALYANGITYLNGNVTINGTCTGCSGGSGTINSGTAPHLAYYSGSTAVSAASALSYSTTRGGLDLAASTTGNGISFGTNGTDVTSLNVGPNSGMYSTTTGNGNIAIGLFAMTSGYGTGSGNQLTAVGYHALMGSGGSASSGNTGIGYNAGSAQINTGNTYVGAGAGQNQGNSTGNVAVGYEANQNSGGNNTVVGASAFGTGTGSNETVMGANACQNGGSGNSNVCIGYKAGFNTLNGGASNILIGPNVATTTLATGSNNILLGTSSAVDTPAAGTSSWLDIGAQIAGSMTALTSSALSSCGSSPSIVAQSSDLKGTFTTGGGASACTLAFTTTRSAAPSCVVSARSGTQPAYTTSISALTLSTAAASATYDYFCSGT